MLLLAAAALLPLPAQAGDGPAKGGRKGAAAAKGDDLDARVDAAIERGARRLLRWQTEEGWFVQAGDPARQHRAAGRAESESMTWGQTALALYTLRACGLPRDAEPVQRGFAWLRAEFDLRRGDRTAPKGLQRRPSEFQTYDLSLALLALDAQRRAPAIPGMDPGSWKEGGSGPRKKGKAPPAPLTAEQELSWMEQLARLLVGAQAVNGGFGYNTAGDYAETAPARLAYEDHSNTQYALLGLKAARMNGIRMDRSIWLRALLHLLECQERNGPRVPRGVDPGPGGGKKGAVSTVGDRARGWGYADGNPATGSMTTGGVSSLAICRSELPGAVEYDADLAARSEQAVFDGLAWLGHHFTVAENPGPVGAPMGREFWLYYYLYGLERAGVLAGAERMGSHDWYGEGAAWLLEHQTMGGAWQQDHSFLDGPFHPPPPGPPGRDPPRPLPPDVQARIDDARGNLLDSCFALLFLKRATRAAVATVQAEDRLDLRGAADLPDRDFGDLFAAVFRGFAAAAPGERRERAADFVRMGTRSLPLLMLRLDDAEAAVRGAALDALRETTGLTHGFDPAAPEEARGAAVRAWEDWWASEGRRLVADTAAGRFR